MLVPMQGTVTELKKRTRTLPQMQAALNTIKVPPVYIFNIFNRAWPNRVGAGRSYSIPACEPGEAYSKPVEVSSLVFTEYDPAGGAGVMGVTSDPGMNAEIDGQHLIGVTNDIIGTNSTSAALDPFTTNLEWFGVFATMNKVPTKEELAKAKGKLSQMMRLIYAKGAEKIEQNEPVAMLDRGNYNDAANFLGRKPLWGHQEHILDRCIFCQESIQEGAIKCRHCNERLDSPEAKKLIAKKLKAKPAAETQTEDQTEDLNETA
jgi:hypothetical protein